MVRALLIALVIGYAAANICTNDRGTWSYGLAQGVTDFAYTGVNLNNSFYCFEGCLITGDVVQNYKVLLSGNNGQTPSPMKTSAKANVPFIEKYVSYEERVKNVRDTHDPNAFQCVDPALRAQIATALNGLTGYTAKIIARTLQYQLNRPGWCINVVKIKGGDLNGFYQDYNFCNYDTVIDGEMTNIRLAAIDFSK